MAVAHLCLSIILFISQYEVSKIPPCLQVNYNLFDSWIPLFLLALSRFGHTFPNSRAGGRGLLLWQSVIGLCSTNVSHDVIWNSLLFEEDLCRSFNVTEQERKLISIFIFKWRSNYWWYNSKSCRYVWSLIAKDAGELKNLSIYCKNI